MRRDVRNRLLLPILLPVGILIGMLALMFLFSRILLNTSADAAAVVALTVAISIIAGAGVLSGRRRGRVRGGALGSLLGIVAGVAMLAGGIALAVARPGGEGGGEAPGAKVFQASVIAPSGAATKGFDSKQLDFPAGTRVDLTFDNQDSGVQHNVQILSADPQKDPNAEVLFAGDTVTGPAKAGYEIEPLKQGTYFFHCSIHPTTMMGTVVVKPGGTGGGGSGEGGSGGGTSSPTPSSEGGGSGGGATVSVTASQIQFDTTELTLPAGTDTQLEFSNQDAGVPHNLSIYDGSDQLFTFEPFPGPASKTLTIPGLPAGSYTFQCDVHPTMNGTVSVS